MERGCFIVFEGIDGAGKSTQAKILAEKLISLGKRVYMTAEPTDMPSGKALREVLGGKIKKSDSEIALMFTLDRVAHNIDKENGIERMLDEGAFIICDRYYYSSLAYQGSTVDYSWVRALNVDCPAIRHPDLCIFLDLTPKQSMQRISCGRETTEIYESEEILSRVRNSFMRVIEDMSPIDTIKVVDASGSVDEIADNIFRCVAELGVL